MKPDRDRLLGFIGAGVVGTALAEAAADAGYSVAAVYSRNPERRHALALRLRDARAAESAQEVVDACDVVFLTVSDDAIRPVSESIRWTGGKGAVHCNGAASLELLRAAAAGGAAVGVMHPLQSFASVARARSNLPGSTFTIEASTEDLQRWLAGLARALGGVPMTLRGDKSLYHVSAVIASNYLVTLLDLASGLWAHLGLDKEQGLHALLPLVRGTVENVETLGLPAALTGPVARGDLGTVRAHLEALRRAAPELLPAYTELARRAAKVACAKGTLNTEIEAELRDVLAGIGGREER